MSTIATSPAVKVQRHLGTFQGEENGPTLICTGGIHGNEPAALMAIHEVLQDLQRLRPDFRGRICGFSGNLPALRSSLRFIDEDLNRIWSEERMQRLYKGIPEENITSEVIDQLELYRSLQPYLEQMEHLCVLDLHTTSSRSAPFLILQDTTEYRQFAVSLPVPVILGLNTELGGTLIHWIRREGGISLGFEAGQHYSRSSVDNHIAAIWSTLSHLGCLDSSDIPHYEQHQQTLRASAGKQQRFYQLVYHYRIQPGEQFRMEPGYSNFQPVQRGEPLASNQHGPIECPCDGAIFMPLYQQQGNDGFFVVQNVS